jgi:DNA-binding NarL/FixJ family response regulator
MTNTISVLLVDDHAVVREGYKRLLQDSGRVTVVAEAENGADAYRLFCNLKPNVVVMDIALPGVSGIEGTRRIVSREPNARVLVFSMYEDAIFVRRAIEAGAMGYVTKASAPHVLVEAVDTVATGKRYLSHDVAQTLALSGLDSSPAAHHELSAREFEVLKLLVQGHSLNDIAEQLGLNQKTVANHQSAIKQKLGAESTAQLFRVASRLGLVSLV